MGDIASGLISAGIKGITSLFGSKSKPPTTSEIVIGNAEGARKAADMYGFNPLTMLQYASNGGGGGGGAGSLVSNELLLGAVQDVADVVTGESARKRAAEDLQTDLQKLRIEQARDGVVQVTDNATDRVGSGRAALGRSAATYGQPSARPAPNPAFSAGENFIAPGRETKVAPLENISGVMEVENNFTGGKPVTIPGSDGDVMGVDELMTLVGVGAPQAGYNYLTSHAEKAWKDNKPPSYDLKIGSAPVKQSFDFRTWPFRGFSADNYKR